MKLKFLKDLFTDNTGEDADIVSVMGALLIIAFIVIVGYDVIKNGHALNIQDFGIAGAALLGALGGAFHFKANKGPQEPK